MAPSVEEVARLFPQLEILGFIGQGGMGAVYKARQKALARVVALKILPPGIGQDPAFAERFTREAKALARLNHPGVVTLYEFGQADGLFFFLMEFVDGMSLRHLLEVERISAREALAIVPQICDALQYAHDQGIVHRDIKPENILLDRQGRVKVADFGLAKLAEMDGGGIPLTPSLSPSGGEGVSSLSDAGKVMGTPQYMAPEQREHPTEVDHRADIFSLGVVFYQMLTGELPGKPIEAPSHKVQIDVRLDEVVLRALEKEPARRYQQVSQVKTAVETIATSAAPGRSPNQAEVPQPFPKWLLFRIGLPKWPARPAATRPQEPPIFSSRSAKFSLAITVLGALLVLGAIANFNFVLGVEKTAMLISGAILLAAGCVGLALTMRDGQPRPPAAAVPLPGSPPRPRTLWHWVVAAVGLVLLVLVVAIKLAALARESHKAEAVRQELRAAERARSAAGAGLVRARLPQGEIELVGVSYHPSTNQPWWRPDGSTCSEGPFELRSRTSTTGESMTREFVIRLTGLPADASGPVWKLDRGSWAGSLVHVYGQLVPDLQGISATLPKSARTVTIKVGVGMGAWETVANQVPGGSGTTGVSHQGSNWVVSFPKAEGGLGGARILVTHTVKDWETRVLAVDLDGKEHPATGSDSSGTDAFTQIIAKFPDLPLERVNEFQFQVRPYRWVEFRDVALYPGEAPVSAAKGATKVPGETRVIRSGEREALAQAIQRELGRRLVEAGARYSTLDVLVSENMDSARVSFQGLRDFTNADGTITGSAGGHSTLSRAASGQWKGELGGRQFTVEESALDRGGRGGAGTAARVFGRSGPWQSQKLQKETWRDVGASTPEAALQTLLWAAREGDVDHLEAMMSLRGDGDRDFHGSYVADVPYVLQRVKYCSGVTIEGVKYDGAGMAAVQMAIDGIPEREVAIGKEIRMILVNGAWKCDYWHDSLIAFKTQIRRKSGDPLSGLSTWKIRRLEKEKWKEVGTSTPEGALQRLLWAAREQDMDGLRWVVSLPRERHEEWYRSYTNDVPHVLERVGTGVDMGPDSEGGSGQTPFVAPSVEEVARLFPQLEILGFIGQGGMGAVYKARQKALDRVVALKILPPGIGKDPAFAERFTREAKALAKLNHPGIVTLYDFAKADGLYYFLMEFVDGMSLRHLLEVERISAREALAIVPQICDALQYAHDQGIVHRDIKPENILLDRQGRVKVADFGLAKLVGAEALTPAL